MDRRCRRSRPGGARRATSRGSAAPGSARPRSPPRGADPLPWPPGSRRCALAPPRCSSARSGGGILLARDGERPPDVDGLAVRVRLERAPDVLETPRQHAHDLEGPARTGGRCVRSPPDLPRNGASRSEWLRITTSLLPWISSFSSMSRPSVGPAAEQGEEAGGHAHAAELLGGLGVAQGQVGASVGGDPVEGPQLGPVVAEVGGGERELREGRGCLEQPYQAVGVFVGQRRDQDPLDRAPDRGVGADGDGQGQDGGGGEPGRAPQEADRVAKIMGPHGLH